ncbi:1,4-dihydroxy-2-naphthoate polyprenyltransferase [Nibricoccus sp. IMCC34717]|uniref:1,4-dihydroxy-2-naphthoate polyprenyltransferase n=1 Tax=Nibricoccus sp. IMCC34717 TaxID=3034021 RepID=UPI0038506C37
MSSENKPGVVGIWIQAARPRTLPAAVAPVVVGAALAAREEAFYPVATGLCLGFALLVQIGTNFANDYFDFRKGADTAERVGPKRAVASGWVSPETMRWAMALTFLAAFAVGLNLLQYGGWPLLVIGVASIVAGVAYTGGPYPLGYNGWGDAFVFLFFGLVAVGTTFYVQAGRVSAEALLCGTAVGALAANILVVNNYRDVETDAKAGKRTLVVRLGRGFARGQFLASLAVAFAAPVALVLRGLSPWVLLTWLVLPWAISQVRALGRAEGARELIQLLGETGQLLAVYALLLGAGVLWR